MEELSREELISAYLDGELSGPDFERAEQILASDADARTLCEELRALRAALQAMPRYQVDGDLSARVLRRAEREMLVPPVATNGDSPSEKSAAETAAANGAAANESHAPSDGTLKLAPAVQPLEPEGRSWRPLLWLLLAVAAALLVMVTNRNGDQEAQLARSPKQEVASNQVADQDSSPDDLQARKMDADRNAAEGMTFDYEPAPEFRSSPPRPGQEFVGAGLGGEGRQSDATASEIADASSRRSSAAGPDGRVAARSLSKQGATEARQAPAAELSRELDGVAQSPATSARANAQDAADKMDRKLAAKAAEGAGRPASAPRGKAEIASNEGAARGVAVPGAPPVELQIAKSQAETKRNGIAPGGSGGGGQGIDVVGADANYWLTRTLADGTLVVEVTMTSEAANRRAFDQVLARNDIALGDVDAESFGSNPADANGAIDATTGASNLPAERGEQAATKRLAEQVPQQQNAAQRKGDAPQVSASNGELVYLVASAEQVEAALAELHTMEHDFPAIDVADQRAPQSWSYYVRGSQSPGKLRTPQREKNATIAGTAADESPAGEEAARPALAPAAATPAEREAPADAPADNAPAADAKSKDRADGNALADDASDRKLLKKASRGYAQRLRWSPIADEFGRNREAGELKTDHPATTKAPGQAPGPETSAAGKPLKEAEGQREGQPAAPPKVAQTKPAPAKAEPTADAPAPADSAARAGEKRDQLKSAIANSDKQDAAAPLRVLFVIRIDESAPTAKSSAAAATPAEAAPGDAAPAKAKK